MDHKLITIRNLVTCEQCDYFLDIPIRLPCQAVICNKHVNELKEQNNSNRMKCQQCNSFHEIPEEGFKVDKKFNDIILKKEHLSDDEKQLAKNIEIKVEKLYESFKCLEDKSQLLLKIHEKKNKIRNAIDLEVEQLKKRIDDIRDKFFKEIENFQNKCNDVIENVEMNEMETRIKDESNKWQTEKNSIEITKKTKFESNLDLLLKQIEKYLKDMKNIEDSLKNITYNSNEINLNIFYKSDQFLGDLKIPNIVFQSEQIPKTNINEIEMSDKESKYIKLFLLFCYKTKMLKFSV